MSDSAFETFGKFSPRSRAVLVAAQRYAEVMSVGLGSEHVLLALAVAAESPAQELLRKVPITLDQLRLVLRLEPSQTAAGRMSPEAKSILERAAFHAASHGATTVETEHLLWALVSDTKCTAYRMIQSLGVEPKTIRKTLERQLHDGDRFVEPQEIEILGFIGQGEPVTEPERDGNGTHVAEPDVEEQSDTPLTDEFTVDLVQLAHDDKLDPTVGRDAEIDRLIHILSRKTKSNPVLVGDPGVGKTAIVEGLAARVVKGAVPQYLRDARILSLDLSSLVAGTMYRGQFEERLKRLVAEVEADHHLILFIDEIHTLVGAGGAEGALDAANILKPTLAKGTLRLIGATTATEYQKYIERDAALERRLQPVQVQEPTREQTRRILAGLRPRYEQFHGVKLTDDILDEAIDLAGRYLYDRRFPDKAIDLIDEAAAAVRATGESRRTPKTPSLRELEKELRLLVKEKEYELRGAHFERAAYLRDKETKLRLKLKKLAEQKAPARLTRTVTSADLRGVVSRWTSIPAERLTRNDRQMLLKLEDTLNTAIVGQTEAIRELTRAIRRAKAGLKHPRRPIGSFLLVGPTGVGKTETARLLAEQVFGDPGALLKLDMSEYMERHQAARLIGAPPGYVGHDDISRLLDSVRRRPHQVICFDEIEKAHPDVTNLLLQILEDGVLTDGKGRTVHFHETLVVLTSNIGGELWSKVPSIGFGRRDLADAWQEPIRDLLKRQFRPEFLGRLDGVLVYRPLSTAALATILDQELERLMSSLAAQGVTLTVSAPVRAALVTDVARAGNGARDIRRTVEIELGTLVADTLLRTPNRAQIAIEHGKAGLRVTTSTKGPRHGVRAPH
ncbi:ATP-dependent Clp protease ATP-binding subunit [Candidatus Berkelbacteria bacterium]|nr:ATP-dependent Clp protease ATP-binding subunit [Candidatus Berkelbacteria bacterium]